MVLTIVAALQVAALVVLVGRLSSGRKRSAPVPALREGMTDTTVSVLLPTFNEGRRIGPCLAGLHAQGPPLTEVIITTAARPTTRAPRVEAMAAVDHRFRLIDDRPLPTRWIGKVWALERGRAVAAGEWLLGIDADTEPRPGLVAGVVSAARTVASTLYRSRHDSPA